MTSEAVAIALLLPLTAALLAAGDWGSWWGEPRGWEILGRSLAFSGGAASIVLAPAWLIGRGGPRWAAVSCLPMLVPSSLLGASWIVALGRAGPLGDWLTIFDPPVAATAVGLRYVGVGAFVFAVNRPPPDPAAAVFPVRHRWWWLHARPALRPALVAWLLMALLCSTDHVMPSVFLIQTYGTQVLIQYNALLDLPGAAALAAPMLVPGLLALLALKRGHSSFSRKRGQVAGPSDALLARRTGTGLSPAWAIVVASLPVAALAWRVDSSGQVWEALVDMRRELAHTLLLAVGGGAIAAVLGWGLAEHWRRCRQRRGLTAVPLVLLNLAAPPSLLAFGVIDLAERPPLTMLADSNASLIAALLARYVPLALLVMHAAGLSRDDQPDQAARVLGVKPWTRLCRVTWPRRRGAVLASGVLCALLIATDLDVSVLLTPAGTTTAGVRVYTLIHTAPDSLVAAAALALCLLPVPALLLLGGSPWKSRS